MKVEYLITISEESTCTTEDAFIHLLQINPKLTVRNNSIIVYNKHEFILGIESGQCGSSKEGNGYYFDIAISSKDDGNIKIFDGIMREIRRTLAQAIDLKQSVDVLQDDLSEYYSSLAYPKIARTENLMRKLIVKFMSINVGGIWTKTRIPDDIRQTHNDDSSPIESFVHGLDFIQLIDILLSDKYLSDKEALVSKIKQAEKNGDRLEVSEIKPLIPVSNWDKYFSKIVDMEGKDLSKLWNRLYEKRCKVAHNRHFTPEDLKIVENLCNKLDKVIEKAIDKLSRVKVEQDDAAKIQKHSSLEDYVKSIMESPSGYRYLYEPTRDRKPQNINKIEAERRSTNLQKFLLLAQISANKNKQRK